MGAIDENDRLREGSLPDDPEADARPMGSSNGTGAKAGIVNLDQEAPVVGSFLDEAAKRMMARSLGEEKPIPLPIPTLSEALNGGLWPGLHIIVGNTGSGKSQFALQIGLHAARSGIPVLYIGLELGKVDLVARLLEAVLSRPEVVRQWPGPEGRALPERGTWATLLAWHHLCRAQGALPEEGPAGLPSGVVPGPVARWAQERLDRYAGRLPAPQGQRIRELAAEMVQNAESEHSVRGLSWTGPDGRIEGAESRLEGLELQINPLLYEGVRDPETAEVGSNWFPVPAELARIDHTKHPYALPLGLLLPIRWRWDLWDGRDHLALTGQKLLELAGIPFKRHNPALGIAVTL